MSEWRLEAAVRMRSPGRESLAAGDEGTVSNVKCVILSWYSWNVSPSCLSPSLPALSLPYSLSLSQSLLFPLFVPYVQALLHLHVGPEADVECLPQSVSTLFFETRLLIELEAL